MNSLTPLQRLMSTRLLFHLPRISRWLCIVFAAAAGAGVAQAGSASIVPLGPDEAIRHVRIRTEAPPGALATLQVREDLFVGGWRNEGDPIMTGYTGWVLFNAAIGDRAVPERFFRIAIESFPVQFSDDGRL